MLTEIVLFIVSLFQAFGPTSVFVGVLIEEIIVPLPSQLVLMAAGYSLITSNVLPELIYYIVIPGAIAGTIGSFFAYGVGYYGGKKLIDKYSKFFGVNWKDVSKKSKKLGKGRKLWASLFLSRAIPIIPVFIVSLSFGLIRADIKKFTLFTLLGQIPRTFILGLAGWYLGSAYVKYAEQLGSLQDIILIIIIIGIILFLTRKFAKNFSISSLRSQRI